MSYRNQLDAMQEKIDRLVGANNEWKKENDKLKDLNGSYKVFKGLWAFSLSCFISLIILFALACYFQHQPRKFTDNYIEIDLSERIVIGILYDEGRPTGYCTLIWRNGVFVIDDVCDQEEFDNGRCDIRIKGY